MTGLCAFSSNHDNCYLALPASTTSGAVLVYDALDLHALCQVGRLSCLPPQLLWKTPSVPIYSSHFLDFVHIKKNKHIPQNRMHLPQSESTGSNSFSLCMKSKHNNFCPYCVDINTAIIKFLNFLKNNSIKMEFLQASLIESPMSHIHEKMSGENIWKNTFKGNSWQLDTRFWDKEF